MKKTVVVIVLVSILGSFCFSQSVGEKDLSFVEVEQEILKRYPATIFWVKEQRSEVILYRVRSGFDVEKLKKYNGFLKKKHTQKALDMLQYKKESKRMRMIYTSIGFVSKDLFSYLIIDRFEAKDGEFKSDFSGVLYDMKHSEEVSLDHIVALSPQTLIRNTKNKKRWIQYRKEVFAPAIRDEIFASLGWKVGDAKHDGCDYENTKYWEEPAWYIAKKGGIQLIPNFSKKMHECKNNYTFILPLKWLKEHKNKKYAKRYKTFYNYDGGTKK